MRLLLSKGADPTITTFNGTTALMAAAGVNWVVGQTYSESPARWLEAVQLCLELGGDVNAVNEMGLGAVHGAANRGSDDIIELLARRGARLDVPDKEGRTPYVWAEGVFLATNSPVAKPSTMALIKTLLERRTGGNGQTMNNVDPAVASLVFVAALSASLPAVRQASAQPTDRRDPPRLRPDARVSSAVPASLVTTRGRKRRRPRARCARSRERRRACRGRGRRSCASCAPA